MKQTPPPLITILGPTASGKTKLAVELAQQFSGEIISADSRQVYRDMDIGTGKDLSEYRATPYHLIDIIDPSQEFNVFEFSKAFCTSYHSIVERSALPFLVGGTGMYLSAVLNRYNLTIANYDKKSRLILEKKSLDELSHLLQSLKPSQHNSTDLVNKARTIQAIQIATAENNKEKQIQWPQFAPLLIGIKVSREVVKQRITERLKIRFSEGMIEEVENLHARGISWDKLHFFGLEYRFIAQYLKGELSYNDMFQKLNSAIHYFAKQQEKWFRKLEKQGHHIEWVNQDSSLSKTTKALVQNHILEKN